MPDKKSFNLVYSPWVFLVDGRRVSLKQLFEEEKPVELAGTPIERLEVFRLLLAIAHSACRLEDVEEWLDLDVEEMKASVTEYLEKWSSRFDLYDPEHPFLQFPKVSVSEKKILSLKSLAFGISNGNTTVLTQGNVQRDLTDAESAYVLLQQNIFPLSGKKGDPNCILVEPKQRGNFKKSASAPYSSAMGYGGYLHTYALGQGLMQTLLLNLLSEEEVRSIRFLSKGIGTAPWEKMPHHELEKEFFETYIGWLLPFARFCRIDGENLHFTSGLVYPKLETGIADPSVAVLSNPSSKTRFSAVRASLTEQPWRQMEALLSYMSGASGKCWQVEKVLSPERIRDDVELSGLWSAGVQVTFKAGEQYFGAGDGFVNSEFRIRRQDLNTAFFSRYQAQVKDLEKLAKVLWGCIEAYYKDLGAADAGKGHAEQASERFWEFGNRLRDELVDACLSKDLSAVRKKFKAAVFRTYDESCPHGSGRQLLSWGKCRPNLGWYE